MEFSNTAMKIATIPNGINHECDHMHIMECSTVLYFALIQVSLIVTAYIWQGLVIAVVTFLCDIADDPRIAFTPVAV